MRVYVAGSSVELERAASVRDAIVARGNTITEDWISKIFEHLLTGRAVNELSPEERREAADADYVGVASADCVVLLVPRSPVATRGAWWEGGVADALGIPVIASGLPADRAPMIFLSRVHEVDTDQEAIDLVGSGENDLLRRYIEQQGELERLRAHIARIEGSIADVAAQLRLNPPSLRPGDTNALYARIMAEVRGSR